MAIPHKIIEGEAVISSLEMNIADLRHLPSELEPMNIHATELHRSFSSSSWRIISIDPVSEERRNIIDVDELNGQDSERPLSQEPREEKDQAYAPSV